jgi:PAS domain S-box-containing protein
MKINMPVTDVEHSLREGQTVVSRTDLKGVINYINKDFLEISGFNEEELIGKSQNIVRHPDMPPGAFADLWSTVKGGRPWRGLVKNPARTATITGWMRPSR